MYMHMPSLIPSPQSPVGKRSGDNLIGLPKSKTAELAKTKKTLNCELVTRPFLSQRVGSGDKTSICEVLRDDLYHSINKIHDHYPIKRCLIFVGMQNGI